MLLLFLVGVVIVASAIGKAGGRGPPAPLAPPDEPSPTELAADDPVEALLRFGTADDAARLADQGIELEDLGYRPPRDE